MSAAFAARAARDACGYSISWTVDANQITGVTVSPITEAPAILLFLLLPCQPYFYTGVPNRANWK